MSETSRTDRTDRTDRTVALFVTCLTDQFYPRVGLAVMRVLERLGWRVEFPQAQTCCGQPCFNNGFHPEARDLAKRFVELFERYPCVVTPSGSCCAMVRTHFAELLHDDPAWLTRVKALGEKTFEFVEFLGRFHQAQLTSLSYPRATSATYHYTCHLRSLGMTNEAVDLLRSIGNIDFRPLEKADQCCGFGGTFAIKYPQISGVMVEDKVKLMQATGAEVTICNDAGCTMNIAGMCNRHGVNMRISHIAEILAKAMGLSIEET